MNKTKPNFIRYNSEYLKKLSANWRKAKGLHNKVRLKKKGHSKSPSIGYRIPKEVRGFYQSKFDYALILSENDLLNLDKKYVILSNKLGLKNKLKIIEKLKTLGIKILNIKDIDKFIKDVQEKLKSKKEDKKFETRKKEETKKKIDQKIVEKEAKELTKEEKAEIEKLEKKRVLEKGQ